MGSDPGQVQCDLELMVQLPQVVAYKYFRDTPESRNVALRRRYRSMIGCDDDLASMYC